MSGRVARLFVRGSAAVLFSVTLVALGCSPSGDPTAATAEKVFRQKIQERPEYAAYAFAVAKSSEAPQIRAIVLESLDSENYATAVEAVKALGEVPPEAARESLRRRFDEGRGALKLYSGIALARMGDEQALEWVRETVRDAGPALNPDMAILLANGDDDELIAPILRQRMDSENLAERNAAYAMLGAIDKTWARTLLKEGLKHEHGEDRVEAIAALGRAGDPAAASQIEPLANYQGLVLASIEALGTLGNSSSVSVVRELSKHDVEVVRAYASVALWKLGEKETATAVIEPLLTSEIPTVRRDLAEQLESVEDPSATEWLIQLSRDTDESVRLAAVRGLAGRATPEAVERLAESASDADYEVATAALNGLASAGGEEVLSRIEPLMNSENPYVAISAANAVLAIVGDRATS